MNGAFLMTVAAESGLQHVPSICSRYPVLVWSISRITRAWQWLIGGSLRSWWGLVHHRFGKLGLRAIQHRKAASKKTMNTVCRTTWHFIATLSVLISPPSLLFVRFFSPPTVPSRGHQNISIYESSSTRLCALIRSTKPREGKWNPQHLIWSLQLCP
jgi:hypothetical protein